MLRNVRAGGQRKRDRISGRIDENVPIFVRGDPHRIHQALVILLGNAVKFTERGFVRIVVAPCPDGSGSIRFTVSDSGVGISSDRHPKLFENLPLVNMAVLRRHTKRGLGLPVCLRIIEAMGGRMGFQSSLGKGSSFWFDVLLPEAGSPTILKCFPIGFAETWL